MSRSFAKDKKVCMYVCVSVTKMTNGNNLLVKYINTLQVLLYILNGLENISHALIEFHVKFVSTNI